MDLWTSPIVATTDTKYYLLVDDYNIYQRVYFLNAKYDVASIFDSFMKMVERKFNTKVKSIQRNGVRSLPFQPQ